MAAEEKLGEIFVEIKAKTDALDKEMKQLKGRLDKDAHKMSSSFGKMFNNGLKSVLKLAGGYFGLQAAMNFGRKILDTASQFEQLRTRLVSLYGDADKAQIVFNKFKKIAATTPFSLKGVVEAGATLKAFGMDAENTLKEVTDLAAYMGLDVVEAANAVGRAFAGGAGAADILRERGVLNLIKDFKGIDDLSKLTLPEFRKALIESMQDPAAGISGSTDRMSKTFAGAFSNMEDAVDNFTAALGGGSLSGLKNLVRQATSLFEALTPTTTALDEAKVKAFELSYNFDNLTGTYLRLREKTKLTKEETDLYRDTIKKLQSQYPNYFKNVDLHKGKLDNIKTAFSNARIELDKYIASLMKQAVIEQNKEKIGNLAQALGEYTIILNGLKNAQDQVNKTGVDPFAKMSPDQRGKLIEEGDLTTGYRTANIFTPLDEQVKNVQNKITELEGERDRLTTVIQQMTDAFGKATSPGQDPGGGGGDQEIVDIKTRQAALKQFYEDLKFGARGYYDYRIKEINREAEEIKKAAGNEIDIEKWKIDQITKLNDEKRAYFDDPLLDTAQMDIELNDEILKSYLERDAVEQKVHEAELERAGESLKSTQDMIESNQLLSDIQQNMGSEFISILDDMRIKTAESSNFIVRAMAGMANSVISAISSMIAKWLAWKAVLGIASIFTGGGAAAAVASGPAVGNAGFDASGFAAQGGSFVGTNGGVKKMAGGGSFIVGPGHPNDTYPLLVRSGEGVDVTPSHKMGQRERELQNINKSLGILNSNMVDMMIGKQSDQTEAIPLYGQLDGKDIYISNKRSGKRYGRMR